MEDLEQIEQQEILPPQPSPKKKYVLIGVVAALIVLVAGSLAFIYLDKSSGTDPAVSAQCNQLEQKIATLIEQVNYCEVDSDCVVSTEITYGCGCSSLVHKDSDLSGLKAKVSEWKDSCSDLNLLCSACDSTVYPVSCKQNKCVFVYDTSNSSTDSTANWQIYKNEALSFMIKLPNQWDVRELSPAEKAEIGTDAPDIILGEAVSKISLKNRDEIDNISIYALPFGDDIDLEELFFEGEDYEAVMVNGKQGFQFLKPLIGSIDENVAFKATIVQSSQTTLMIVGNFVLGDSPDGLALQKEQLDVYDILLSTLEFLDGDDADDISTWRTYINSEHGYSLKIPLTTIEKEDSSGLDKAWWLVAADSQGLPFTGELVIGVVSQVDLRYENKDIYQRVQNGETIRDGDILIRRIRDLSLDGCTATQIVTLSSGTELYETFCSGSNKMLLIDLGLEPEWEERVKNSLKAKYDLILSTFQFNEFSLD